MGALATTTRRPKGTGSVHQNGAGWRWGIKLKGKRVQSRTWGTRGEALAELDMMVSNPAHVPAVGLRRSRRWQTETGKAKAKGKGSKKTAPRPPIPPLPEDDSDAPFGPPPRLLKGCLPGTGDDDPAIDAAERATPAWGPRKRGGVRMCLPCAGEGIDRRPGPGAGRCCLNCGGEGSAKENPLKSPAAPDMHQ